MEDNSGPSLNWTTTSNYSSHFLVHEQVSYPLSYQIIATILHSLIFIFGVAGNCVVILVVTRSKSLHSPAYTYLVSLAVADLIVLISTVPEAILGHYIGNQWLFGQVGCSLFIFSNFLGINAGSLSILAFTIEQHVAVCGSAQWIQRLWQRTRLIIVILWLFTIVYCSPWLFALTEVRPDPSDPTKFQCTMSLSRQLYLGLFGTDFILFYIIPLVVALICYGHIAVTLNRLSGAGWRTPNRCSIELPQGPHVEPSRDAENLLSARRQNSRSTTMFLKISDSAMFAGRFTNHITPQSRKQVLRMLVVIVVLFAITWLPYRGLLLYNSLADNVWLDLWFVFFAKTLIYFNSAMNPYLYNAMSRRFRVAVQRLLCFRTTGKAAGNTRMIIKRNRAAKESDMAFQ